MKPAVRHNRISAPLLAGFFLVGTIVGWSLRGGPPQPAETSPVAASQQPPTVAPPLDAHALGDQAVPARVALPTKSEPSIGPAIQPTAAAIDELASRDLRLPVDRAEIEKWKGMFAEGRDRNRRPHEAVDILAPRETPIHAVENGTIAKLFFSKAGGNTVYEFDPDQRFCYYYAHLERYAAGLEAGRVVKRGDVIGYVGTSGNAPPDTPHLHFAIFALDANRHWWQGLPLDPYLVFAHASTVKSH